MSATVFRRSRLDRCEGLRGHKAGPTVVRSMNQFDVLIAKETGDFDEGTPLNGNDVRATYARCERCGSLLILNADIGEIRPQNR